MLCYHLTKVKCEHLALSPSTMTPSCSCIWPEEGSVAVTWPSNTWLLKENSAQGLACVSLSRDGGIELFSRREVLLYPADTSHVDVPCPSCPGWRLWGPRDSISDFVESCPIGYSVLPVCGNQFNAASQTQSSSHLGFTNFMQLAALKIWMHSLKDSTEEKQLIMGNYAFWDR